MASLRGLDLWAVAFRRVEARRPTAKGTTDVTSEPESARPPAGHEAPRNGVSRTVLVLSVLVAIVVAGVAGLAIGGKVEQDRVKDDITNIRPVGTVTAVTDNSVTVDLLTSSGTRSYVLTDETVVDSSESGDVSEVVEGSIILVKNKRDSDGKLQATEIIVLPDSTTFGGGARSERSDG